MFYTALFLLIAGFCILALELFVPSAGMLGALAGCIIIASVVIAFLTSSYAGMIFLLVTLLLVPIMLLLMIKIWPHTPIGKRLLSDDETLTDVLPQGKHYDRSDLAGKTGIAKTMMLPSGQIVIDGQKYDAVSDGFAIDAGDRVKVVSIKKNRIYVQPCDDNESLPEAPAADDTMDQSTEKFDLDSDSIDRLLEG